MQQQGEHQNLLIIEHWSLWDLPLRTKRGLRLLIPSQDLCTGAQPPCFGLELTLPWQPGLAWGVWGSGAGLPFPGRRWEWASWAQDLLRGRAPTPQAEFMQSPLGGQMQSNADLIASVMREGSAGSKISRGNVAPLICGHWWLWIFYLKCVLWGCRNTGLQALERSGLQELAGALREDQGVSFYKTQFWFSG